ncbi:RDD family protein [Thermomonospora catenispora]|uniref:RDD family protein n=1 Tax=Thermomonospora catenispora TaxID=2493090 RepID=UPI00111D1C1E|nr:RDD family protein [Thermomonospora catenispora]TNY37927.1 RDD family protein [Thermomonospora catenispora]
MTDRLRPHYVRPSKALSPGDGRPVLVLATAWSRVWARLIDLLIAFLVAVGLLTVPMVLTVTSDDLVASETLLAVEIAMLALVPVAWMLLRVALTVWTGATIGQRIMGIRPVLEEDGGRPGWRAAFRRWFSLSGHPTGDTELVPFLHDFLAHRRDGELGRCRHDRQAGTVVVRARYSAWQRAVLAGAVGAVVLGTIGVFTYSAVRAALGPSFSVETYYGEDRVFRGHGVTFERTSAEKHGGEDGCRSGAADDLIRSRLKGLDCRGRLSASFVTADGRTRVSSHILRFDEKADAQAAERSLKWDDLVFVSAPGAGRLGMVGSEDRFVVITAVEGDDERALRAFHTTLLGVIIIKHL